jgi:SAM-dependent methyltransferase
LRRGSQQINQYTFNIINQGYRDNMQNNSSHTPEYQCAICEYKTESPDAGDLGTMRGNTARFLNTEFHLWKCPHCGAIHNVDPVDYADIYSDYPLNQRKLDVFARGTLRNLLRRLEHAGLQKEHSILDYGCGNGVMIQFLKERGYQQVSGYDPYVAEYAELQDHPKGFDCVIANDVLEHTHDPRGLLHECSQLVRPGGLLYAGTADSEGVTDMHNLDTHVMRLHQPFHRVIICQADMLQLGEELQLELINSWKRSYMDTSLPFSNYRFLDEFNSALKHNMDLALDPAAGKIMLTHPRLWFYAFFGYFFPSAYEPAVLWRKPVST